MDRERDQNRLLEKWNERLDTALKNLPEQSAPSDLLPRVMTKVRARREEKGLRHPWVQWPLWLRATTAVPVLALTAYLCLTGLRVYETIIIPAYRFSSRTSMTLIESLTVVLGGTRSGIGSEVLHYVLPLACILLFGMYLTCIGAGTFLYRTVRR
jgi:hypothetical protein